MSDTHPDPKNVSSPASGAARGLPVRYDTNICGDVVPHPSGPFVLYEDYDRLVVKLEAARDLIEELRQEYHANGLVRDHWGTPATKGPLPIEICNDLICREARRFLTGKE